MKTLITLLIFSFVGLNTGYGQNVAVWDFTTRDGEDDQMTENFTYEFEEALVNYGGVSVLERRNMDRLVAVIENERAVQDILQMSESAINDLKQIGVEQVVFGEIYDDIDGGEISIRVTFQELNGEKALVKSTYMRRGLLSDGRSRRDKMKELVESLSPTEKTRRDGGEKAQEENMELLISDLKFSLEGCTKNVNRLTCVVMITNMGADREVRIMKTVAKGATRIIDQKGIVVEVSEASTGTTTGRYYYEYNFAKGIPTRTTFTFENVEDLVSPYPLFEIRFWPLGRGGSEQVAQFRDVPVSNGGE